MFGVGSLSKVYNFLLLLRHKTVSLHYTNYNSLSRSKVTSQWICPRPCRILMQKKKQICEFIYLWNWLTSCLKKRITFSFIIILANVDHSHIFHYKIQKQTAEDDVIIKNTSPNLLTTLRIVIVQLYSFTAVIWDHQQMRCVLFNVLSHVCQEEK